MAQNKTRIVLEATDKASPKIDKVSNAVNKLKHAGSQSKNDLSGFAEAIGKISNPALLAAAAVVGLSQIIGQSMAAYREHAQEEQKLLGLLQSHGEIAGVLMDRYKDLAKEISLATNIDSTDLIKAMASLEKFGITDMEKAANAVADVGRAIGSLDAASEKLGKALQSPSAKLGELAEIGITFTDAEKEKIKTLEETNRLAEAQAFILDRVNDKYGQVAESMAQLPVGQLDAWNLAWDNFFTAFGKWALNLPVIGDALKGLTGTVNDVAKSLDVDATRQEYKKIFEDLIHEAQFTDDYAVIASGPFRGQLELINRAALATKNHVQEIMDKLASEQNLYLATAGATERLIKLRGDLNNPIFSTFRSHVDTRNLKEEIALIEGLLEMIEARSVVLKAAAEAPPPPPPPPPADSNPRANTPRGNTSTEAPFQLYQDPMSSLEGQIEEYKDKAEELANTEAEFWRLREQNINNPEYVALLDEVAQQFGIVTDATAQATKSAEEWAQEVIDGATAALDTFGAYAAPIVDVVGAAYDYLTARHEERIRQMQAELEEMKTSFDEELQLRKDLGEETVQFEVDRQNAIKDKEREIERETKEQKRNAFIADKASKISQTLASGAYATVQALGVPPAPNFFLAGLTAGAVGVQSALIAAQPIPSFADGGYVPATPGGRIVRVAEAGKGEFMIPEDRISRGGGDIYITIGTLIGAPTRETVLAFERELQKARREGKI